MACEHMGVNRSERHLGAKSGGARKQEVESGSHPGRPDGPAYLSLSQAARLAPGRPSSSATWRWCRKGLKARDGSSVYLKHVRVGRTVYTTASWLHQFFEAVAAADQKHFETRESLAAQAVRDVVAGPPARPAPFVDATGDTIPDRQDDLDAALREAGL